MKRRKIILSLLLAIPLLMTSCLKEDFGDCLYITFDATNPKHVYSNLVERVSLYFYNPDGTLAREYRFAKSELRRSDGAAIISDMPAGNYRLLVLVNDDIHTTTEGTANYSTVATRVSNAELNHNAVPFMSGERQITIVADRDDLQTENVTLVKHNNNIFLNILYNVNEGDKPDPDALVPNEGSYVPTEGTNLVAWVDAENRQLNYEPYQNGNAAGHATGTLISNPWVRVDNGPDHHLPDHPSQFGMTTMRLWHDKIDNITIHLEERPTSRSRADGSHGLNTFPLEISQYFKYMEHDNGNLMYATDAQLEFYDEYHISVILTDGAIYLGAPENNMPPIKIGEWNKVTDNIHVR